MSEVIKKLYYSISEVSEMTGLKQYVLRYWENEFDLIKTSKNRAGNRIYTKDDIDAILTIKQLLYEEKYTIDGAKKKLKDVPIIEQGNVPVDVKRLVGEIRNDLTGILAEIAEKK